MPIAEISIDDTKRDSLKERSEGHFFDFKSRRISPASLSKTISALANADGGEVYVGIEDPGKGWAWDGFSTFEDANGHIQLFERLFPLGQGFGYEFISHPDESGLVLRIEIEKAPDIKRSSDDRIYVRRGAQNLCHTSEEDIRRLQYVKGIFSYEDNTTNADIDDVANSVTTLSFMIDVVPDSEPVHWLKKQKLINHEKPTVAGCVIFSDEPQIVLPKAAIKIYRYKSTDLEGTRETLEFQPITIEGPLYDQIRDAVGKTKEITENIPLLGDQGLEKLNTPR